jgi:uridine kinase
MTSRITILYIGGGSASGKTELARALSRARPDTLTLSEDHYYFCCTTLRDFDPATYNFDEPAAKDLALLGQHLDGLRRGETIVRPSYDFASYRRIGEGEACAPTRLIVLEGLHALSDPALRRRFDVSVFVEAPEELRLSRRLMRDVRERGYRVDEVIDRFRHTVRPMHDLHIEPQRAFADLILSSEHGTPEELAVQLLARLA